EARTIVGRQPLRGRVPQPVQLFGLAPVDATDEPLGKAHVGDTAMGPNKSVSQLGEAENARPTFLCRMIVDLQPGNGVKLVLFEIDIGTPAAPFAVVRAQPEPVFLVEQEGGSAAVECIRPAGTEVVDDRGADLESASSILGRLPMLDHGDEPDFG